MAADAPAGRNEVVGRATELSRLDSFLDAVASGPAALVLEGEPGIGKTTLWKRGMAAAADRGWPVWSGRPAESEAKLSFAGLADLLEKAGEAIDGIPDPQRHALEVALLRAEPGGAPPDPHAVSAAVLSALRQTATRGPFLVALDDVQWLDHATGRALEFAARRLEEERVGLLLSVRETGRALPLDLSHGFPKERTTRLALEPLSPDALGELLRARLGATLPRPTLKRLHEISGGNPFYALEIAAAELRGEQGVTGQALPIPKSLRQDFVRDRLRVLPALAREALLFASACSRPTVGLLETAMGRANIGPQLAKAADAGIVETDGDEIRFTHPLYGSAIYAEASRDHRHRVHRRLGEVVPDPEERARHLALAADGPDPGIALALEEAAKAALARGSPISAAELCELAERLTPPDHAANIRRLRMSAADYRLLAGDYEMALSLLEPVASTVPRGRERAEALRRLGRVLFYLADDRRAVDVLGKALLEEGVPLATLGSIHAWRSWALNWSGDVLAAERHAEEALRLAELGDDPAVLVEALTALATIRTALGRGMTHDLIERALELEGSIEPFSVTDRPSLVHANQLVWTGELDEARRICTALLEEATARGDEDSVGELHRALGQVELLAGNWEASHNHYEKGIALGANPGSWLGTRAIVEACVGDVESARADASEALDEARGGHSVVGELLALTVLGFLELSLGNAAAANEHLRQAWRLHHRLGFGEPAMFRFVGDYAEVLIELGEHTEATQVIDWLDERGHALDRPWALAVVARYRGLMAAAEGDFQTAFASLDQALKEHERLPMPFERGRTLLVLGTIRRRAKQKRPAREALEEALAIFERLGAPLWAEKARAELARIGGRRAAGGQLTEAEARVAKLAAAGRTNREIADALFMSVRTVEGHLSRAYAKLGVRSRTELALYIDAIEQSAHS
ncbi:MAG: ATP-binding protein [Actinomycetota bacterium]